MKIGIITQSFTNDSGVAEHVFHTAKELKSLGQEPTVITANFVNDDDDRGLSVIRVGQSVSVPANGAFVDVTVGYKLGLKLKEIFDQEKFDLLHIHSPLDPFLPLWAVKVAETPIVGTFHTFASSTLAYDLLGEKFRTLFRKIKGHIAVSEAARNYINHYFPADYKIIPNGVDINRFNPKITPIKKFNDDVFNIVFVGRIDPRKGLRYLLQAFAIIYGHNPKVRLIVVGKGLLTEYYKMFLLKDLENKVFFEGYASAEELPHYYATADVFCAPSTHGESFGLVLLEAMASGKPVIASDNDGYRTVLSSKEGILTEPKNVVQLAKAIITLMDDKKKRLKIGQAGRKKADQYSWDKITKKILDYYLEVLKRSKK